MTIYGEATRTITVKQGTAIFFPIINVEWDDTYIKPRLGGTTSWPNGKPMGIAVLMGLVNASIDKASGVFANLNREDTGTTVGLPIVRLQSPPFAYKLPATDNVAQDNWGLDIKGTVAPAISDGLWVPISGDTLTPGSYVLDFGGQIPYDAAGDLFIEHITYNITVLP